MKVKNNKTINAITKSILKGNKRRNRILIIAIALTCILFTTIFTMLFGFKDIFQESQTRSLGSRDKVVIDLLSKEMAEKLKNNTNLKGVSETVKIGGLSSNKLYGNSVELNWGDDKSLENHFVDLVEGNYPTEKNDIVMDTKTLELLGYPAKIGTKINIDYKFGAKRNYSLDANIQNNEFILSGYYNPPIESDLYIGQAFVSKEYLETLDYPRYGHTLGINEMSMWNIESKLTNIVSEQGFAIEENSDKYKEGQVEISVNPTFEISLKNLDPFVIMASVGFLSIVILMGYLLIYNVMAISVVEDIKLYGLLKTIGSTSKQLKKILLMQGLQLSLIGIPIGLSIGFLIGKIFLPIAAKSLLTAGVDYSNSKFNIFIFIFAAVFSVLTIYISCLKPARVLRKLNPIESVNYQEVSSKRNKNIPNLFTLARRYAYENKGRFIIVLLSISLSITILNSVLSISTRLDTQKMYEDEIITDYILADGAYFLDEYDDNNLKTVSENTIEDIESQQGFKNGGRIYYNAYYPYLKESWEYRIKDSEDFPQIFGIDEYLLKKQQFLKGSFNEDLNSVYLGMIFPDEEPPYDIGDKLTLEFEKGNYKNYNIAGIIVANNSNSTSSPHVYIEDAYSKGKITGDNENDSDFITNNLTLYFHPEEYKNITNDNSIMSYSFDIEKNYKENFNNYLENSLIANSTLKYDSLDNKLKDGERFRNSTLLIGTTLAIIVATLGCINMMNLLTTNMLKNRREYGVLEAIGLDSRRRKKMFFLQGLAFVIPSILLGTILSVLTDIILVNAISDYLPLKPGISFLGIGILSPILILIAIFLPYSLQRREDKNTLIEKITG